MIPESYKPYLSGILISEGFIQDRITALAAELLHDWQDLSSPPHLLVVLKGASTFFGDLLRALSRRHANSGDLRVPCTFDFVRVKSYEGTESTGNVRVSGIDLESLRGRHLVIIEDIIDTGATMAKLVPMLQDLGAASVQSVSLLQKRTERACGYRGNYVGFEIPDAFVVGYCLDYNEAFREMQHIAVINAAGIAAFKDFEENHGPAEYTK